MDRASDGANRTRGAFLHFGLLTERSLTIGTHAGGPRTGRGRRLHTLTEILLSLHIVLKLLRGPLEGIQEFRILQGRAAREAHTQRTHNDNPLGDLDDGIHVGLLDVSDNGGWTDVSRRSVRFAMPVRLPQHTDPICQSNDTSNRHRGNCRRDDIAAHGAFQAGKASYMIRA